MAKNQLPKWQERQKLLYSKDKKVDSQKLSILGKLALEQGYLQDALEYFKAAQDAAGMKKVKEIALQEGDVFIFSALEKESEPFDAETWTKVGYRAMELKKYRFAKTAFEKTENELMLAKLEALLREHKDVS